MKEHKFLQKKFTYINRKLKSLDYESLVTLCRDDNYHNLLRLLKSIMRKTTTKSSLLIDSIKEIKKFLRKLDLDESEELSTGQTQTLKPGRSEYDESHQMHDFDALSSSKHFRTEKYHRSRSRSRKKISKKLIYRRGTDAMMSSPEARIRSNSHIPKTGFIGRISPLKNF